MNFWFIINYIPGVTREAVDTTGHGEGKHRKVLTDYESHAKRRQNQIKAAFRKDNPRKSPKSTSMSNQKPKKPPTFKPNKQKAKVLRKAVAGLLDLHELDNPEVYWEAHEEVIRKTYPWTWEALKHYGLWN